MIVETRGDKVCSDYLGSNNNIAAESNLKVFSPAVNRASSKSMRARVTQESGMKIRAL